MNIALVPCADPAALDLPLVHLVCYIVDILELELVGDKLIKLEVMGHCHMNEPGDVQVIGNHAIAASDYCFLMECQYLKW